MACTLHKLTCFFFLFPNLVSAQFPAVIDLAKFADDVRIIYGSEDGFDDIGADLAVGDFNGDGFNDIVAGAYAYSDFDNSRFNIGRAYIIFGNSEISSMIDLRTGGVKWVRINGDDPLDNTGAYVGSGDVNGDGLCDAIIGGAQIGDVPSAGKLYIVYGRKNWPREIDLNTDGGPISGVTRVNGKQPADSFGGIASASDLNGDGYDDVLVTATNFGEAYILYGCESFDEIINISATAYRITTFHKPEGWDFMLPFALFTDFDGDGYSDVFIGNPLFGQGTRQGAAVIFYGSKEGLPADVSLDRQSLVDIGATFILGDEDRQIGRRFAVGDLDGNGKADLLTCDGLTHRVYAFMDLPIRTSFIDMKQYPNQLFLFEQAGQLGDLVVADVNGDGFDDLITASPNNRGECYIIPGAATLPDYLNFKDSSNRQLAIQILATGETHQFGNSIAAADISNDGLPDIIISDQNAHTIGGASRGEIYVIYGRRKEDLPQPVPFQLLHNYPNPFNASTVIRYRLEQAQVIQIDIYNSRGQHVRRLVEGNMPAGEHRAIWDGYDASLRQVGGGVYFCRIIGENFTESIKLVYLR